MRLRLKSYPTTLVSLALVAGGLWISAQFRAASAQRGGGGVVSEGALSAAAQQQIRALLAEKESRTPAQKKMASSLLHAIKTQRGEAMTRGGEVRELRSAAAVAKNNDRGLVTVDVKAVLTRDL